MIYLIHLERTPSDVKHCIGLLEGGEKESLTLYYVQPGSALLQSLNALNVEWTVVRLWDEKAPRFWWPWQRHSRKNFCPLCGAKLTLPPIHSR